jgi:hypothetical protein
LQDIKIYRFRLTFCSHTLEWSELQVRFFVLEKAFDKAAQTKLVDHIGIGSRNGSPLRADYPYEDALPWEHIHESRPKLTVPPIARIFRPLSQQSVAAT